MADDAVLLVGVDHYQLRQRLAVDIAHQSVALVDRLLRGATVARHRHPSGVRDQPAFLALVPDHRAQHRQRDVIRVADPDAVHHQVEEDEHAGPDLRHAFERAGEMRGGRAADAHHRRTIAGGAQAFRCLDRAGALLLGHGFDGLGRTAIVGIARMGEHAREPGAGALVLSPLAQCCGDVEQRRVCRLDARAVAVGIDLDQHRHVERALATPGGERVGGLDVVQQQGERCAAPHEVFDMRQLGRDDAHRVQDVTPAVVEEIAGFLQGGYGDGRTRCANAGRDVGGLVGLGVRPQRDAGRRKAVAQPRDIALHLESVQDKDRRFECLQVHGSPLCEVAFRVASVGKPGPQVVNAIEFLNSPGG
ncbi:hypothetical protein D3C72_1352430 [compost metagenome]